MRTIVILAVVVLLGGCGKSDGELRVHNRQLCDRHTLSLAVSIYTRKHNGYPPLPWPEFHKLNSELPYEFGKFYEPVLNEIDMKQELIVGWNVAKRWCLEYYGL